MEFERQSDSALPESSGGILDCIVRLPLSSMSKTIIDEMMISTPVQIVIRVSENDDCLESSRIARKSFRMLRND